MNSLKNNVKKHYDPFYLMTLSTALLNPVCIDDCQNDACKIINFIAQAYDIPSKIRDEFCNLILGDMQKIGLIGDYTALANIEMLDYNDYENLFFYEIKGRAIEAVNASSLAPYPNAKSAIIKAYEKMNYDMFHHIYDSMFRFKQIEKQANYGDVNSTRQIGIMYYLGIGCEQNSNNAILYLKRSMLWGDIASTALINQIYKNEKDNRADDYKNLFDIETNYLPKGITIIPDYECATENVQNLFTLISMINQYLVTQSGIDKINIPFTNVINNRKISFDEKYALILMYENKSWKRYAFVKKDTRKIEMNWRNTE